MEVRSITCDAFNESHIKHCSNPVIEQNVERFIAHKKANHMALFNKKDYAMGNNGPIGKAVPGIMHAHMNQDISLYYTISGKGESRDLKLYGLYSHKEAGTGQPPNIKLQKQLGTKLKNQVFESINDASAVEYALAMTEILNTLE